MQFLMISKEIPRKKSVNVTHAQSFPLEDSYSLELGQTVFMFFIPLAQLTAILILVSSFCKVKAFQCNAQYSFVGCVHGISKAGLLHQEAFNYIKEEPLYDQYYYDAFLCKCVVKANRLRYTQIALFKTPSGKRMACRGVNSAANTLQSTLRFIRKAVIGHHRVGGCCNAYVTEDEGYVVIGRGRYSAVYDIIPSFIIIPTANPTTVRTMILTPTFFKRMESPPSAIQ